MRELTQEEFDRYRPYLKRKPRARLCVDDFTANGINIPQELWKGLQRIEDPVQYMEAFLKLCSFIFPKINTIDIQHEINTTETPKMDFSGMSVKELMQLARGDDGQQTTN